MQLNYPFELIDQVQMSCEYPGQNMMVALAIMLCFSDLDEAASTEKTGTGSSTKASQDGRVPGAGDAVSMTLATLERAVDQGLEADALIEALHDQWRYFAGHQDSYKDRVESGLEKARPFEATFREYWKQFLSRSQ